MENKEGSYVHYQLYIRYKSIFNADILGIDEETVKSIIYKLALKFGSCDNSINIANKLFKYYKDCEEYKSHALNEIEIWHKNCLKYNKDIVFFDINRLICDFPIIPEELSKVIGELYKE